MPPKGRSQARQAAVPPSLHSPSGPLLPQPSPSAAGLPRALRHRRQLPAAGGAARQRGGPRGARRGRRLPCHHSPGAPAGLCLLPNAKHRVFFSSFSFLCLWQLLGAGCCSSSCAQEADTTSFPPTDQPRPPLPRLAAGLPRPAAPCAAPLQRGHRRGPPGGGHSVQGAGGKQWGITN